MNWHLKKNILLHFMLGQLLSVTHFSVFSLNHPPLTTFASSASVPSPTVWVRQGDLPALKHQVKHYYVSAKSPLLTEQSPFLTLADTLPEANPVTAVFLNQAFVRR